MGPIFGPIQIPRTKPDIVPGLFDLLQNKYEIVTCADTLRHIIRNMASVKIIIGRPMEAKQVAVNPDEISAWFNHLGASVDRITREFVFNMDETGFSDHTDSGEV
jgi:hypothetical protein